MSRSIAALAVAAALVSAPASAYKLTPEETAMRVPATTVPGTRIDLLVIDHREDVLSGDEKESYEGMSREFYGVPVSRKTLGGVPLATYLGERLRIGFERAGYAARFEPSPPGSVPQTRVNSIAAGQAQALVVDMRDWHYDYGGLRPSFFYDATVLVYDREHHLLASRDFRGEDTMSPLGWKDFKTRFAELYQNLFDRIFATDEIRRALEAGASATGAANDTAPAYPAPASAGT